jgi:hypothetical protein
VALQALVVVHTSQASLAAPCNSLTVTLVAAARYAIRERLLNFLQLFLVANGHRKLVVSGMPATAITHSQQQGGYWPGHTRAAATQTVGAAEPIVGSVTPM